MRYIKNPPNPYNKYSAEYIGEPPPTKLEIFEELATKKIITKAYASGIRLPLHGKLLSRVHPRMHVLLCAAGITR